MAGNVRDTRVVVVKSAYVLPRASSQESSIKSLSDNNAFVILLESTIFPYVFPVGYELPNNVRLVLAKLQAMLDEFDITIRYRNLGESFLPMVFTGAVISHPQETSLHFLNSMEDFTEAEMHKARATKPGEWDLD